MVGMANGESTSRRRFAKFAIKINVEWNPFNMHEVYGDFIRPAILLFRLNTQLASRIESKLILDYSCIFYQVEKSSTSALHRTPDPSTLPTPPSEPKLINVTSSSVTLAWNKVQQKQGSSSFIGYSVEFFSSDLQKGWALAAQRVPSNVVTVSWLFAYANCTSNDNELRDHDYLLWLNS